MDERQLDDLQRQLISRSWLHDDPASHRAGVEDALRAFRRELVRGPAPDERAGAGGPRRDRRNRRVG